MAALDGNLPALDREFNSNMDDFELAIAQSLYYDGDQLCELMDKMESSTHLSILNMNARSLVKHIDEYRILLSTFPKLFDLITVEETWLDESLQSLVAMEQYTFVSKPKLLCKEGGGLGIYIKDGVKYVLRDDLACPQNKRHIFDSMFIEIPRNDDERNIVIGLFYRPPNQDTVAEFTNYINNVTAALSKEKKDLVYLGDMNINLLNYATDRRTADYLDTLLSHGLLPKITVPTRVTHEKGTLIDHIFLKTSDTSDDSVSGTLRCDITDHYMNFLYLEYAHKISHPSHISYRPFTQNNIRKFNESLEACDMSDVYGTRDPSLAYDHLIDNYTHILDNVIPMKTVRFNKYKHKKEPWITTSILKSIKHRDKLHGNMINEKNHVIRERLKVQYNSYRKALSKTIRAAKSSYQRQRFEQCKSDSGKIWQNINAILNKSRNKQDFPDTLTVEEVTITDLKDIANSFNNYYVNVGPDLSKTIKASASTRFKLPRVMSADSFFLFPCDSNEVRGIIKCMKPKSSSGHDNITPKLLTQSYPGILEPLTYIINLSMESGIVPNSMKTAKVVPIYKNSGDKHIMKNYRPVSLLPVLSKVMERIVYNRLYKYLHKEALLVISQYGFQKGLSTELAILELQDRVSKILSERKCCLGIYMDLSKAFDTLDHAILLAKLQHYGIRGIALSWFKSYLSDRKQYVAINGTRSDINTLTCGVPQGSILGPLLFLIYVNDLAYVFDSGIPILFADDTNGIYISSNYPDLFTNVNRELSRISDWFKQNKLAVNESKTKYMLFHSYRNRPPDNSVIILNDSILERVESTKFLGVLIHENLTWQTHIKYICNKLSKITAVLARIKHQLPIYVMKIIYNSLFSSHLLYGITVWGGSPASHLDRMVKLQKKAIRHVAMAKYNSHTEPIFKKLNVLNVDDSYKLQCCRLFYKQRLGTLHTYHSSKLYNPLSQRVVHTRQDHDVNINRWTSNIQKQTLNYKIGTAWNSLPREIKCSPLVSEHSFAKKLKKYYLSKYTDTCNIQGCYVCNSN